MPKALATEDLQVATVPARNGYHNAVHLFTQKKGGVGKSTLAGWVAEYLKPGTEMWSATTQIRAIKRWRAWVR